jgi:hypothetical protein
MAPTSTLWWMDVCIQFMIQQCSTALFVTMVVVKQIGIPIFQAFFKEFIYYFGKYLT